MRERDVKYNREGDLEKSVSQNTRVSRLGDAL